MIVLPVSQCYIRRPQSSLGFPTFISVVTCILLYITHWLIAFYSVTFRDIRLAFVCSWHGRNEDFSGKHSKSLVGFVHFVSNGWLHMLYVDWLGYLG